MTFVIPNISAYTAEYIINGITKEAELIVSGTIITKDKKPVRIIEASYRKES
jgi:hypothetical protein